jgi:hypothetical protein
MKSHIAVIALFVVLMASGCTQINDLIGGGVKGISVQDNTQKEESDILSIQGIDMLPRSPVFAGQEFTFYFTIKNTNRVRAAENVRVDLFDNASFTVRPYMSDCISGPCVIPPMGEKTIQFTMTAPNSSKIAYTRTTQRVGFKVSYDFNSTTIYDIVVLNRNEVLKQQQAGKTLQVTSNKAIGSGPVRIYPSLMGDNFVMGGTKRTVTITLRNEGQGIVENNRIRKGGLEIKFPSEFKATGSFLSRSIFDNIAKTGNFIVTGMASGSTVNGESCSSNDQCLSGCCVYDTELYATVCQACSGGINLQNGQVCSSNSQCSSNCCYNEPGVGQYCQANYYCDSTAVNRANGASCSSNTQCSSGCCYNEVGVGQYCQANYYCDSTAVNRANGATCSSSNQCSSGCCYNEVGVGQYCQADYICNPSANNRANGAPCSSNTQCSSNCCRNEIGAGQYCQAGSFCYGNTATTILGSGNGNTGGWSTTTIISTTPKTTTTAYPEPQKTFECDDSFCYNKIAIDLFDQESSPMMFEIEGPGTEQLYSIYPLTANVRYSYELRGIKDIEIIPTENVPKTDWSSS